MSKAEGRSLRVGSVVVRALCVVLAALLVGTVVYVFTSRARYAYDLEWMEGAIVDHVARVMAGKPLYVAPTVDFVPFIYNPLFYVAGALSASLFGLDFFAIRLVSIVSALAALGLLVTIVRKEHGTYVPGVVAAGVYAGTFPLSGGWFDVARVDSLCLVLCLASLLAARRASTRVGLVAASVLPVLAFATKQNALLMAPALTVGVFALRGRAAALWYGGGTATLLATFVGTMSLTTHGWYWFYAFEVPTGHPLQPSLFLGFWVNLLSRLPVAVALGIYFLARSRARSSIRLFNLAGALAMVLMGFSSFVHSGSWANDLMPAHAGLSLLTGLGLAAASEVEAPGRARALVVAYGIALCQLAVLVEGPSRWLPSAGDRKEGDRFMRTVAQMPGAVLLPHDGHVASRVGKPLFFNEMAVMDVMRTTKDSMHAKALLEKSFEESLSTHRFSAIIWDDQMTFMSTVQKYYRPVNAPFVRDPHAFIPKTGVPLRPLNMHVPN